MQYGFLAGFIMYATNFGNIVDVVNYTLQVRPCKGIR